MAPNLDFHRDTLPVSNSVDHVPAPATLWGSKRFIDIVNLVIKSHKALSFEKFRISLPVKKSDKFSVTKWLEFVFSRQVESLELDFFSYGNDQFVIGELVRESRICLQPQSDLIFFQSLKRLSLSHLTMSGEDIELFLRNCPLLEQLAIKFGTLTSDVQLCGANLALKCFEIFCIFCNGLISVRVSAPNLTCIRFRAFDDTAPEPKLLLENVPKLVEADFNVRTPHVAVQHLASSASYHFSQLQFLRLILSKSKMLFQLQDILANGNGFRMPNLKELFIICREAPNHIFVPATALIWAFPRLEDLKLGCIQYADKDEEHLAHTQVITNDGRSPHQHLKVFILHIYECQNVSDGIADLIVYVSNNCVALRKIIIDSSSTLDPATMDFIIQRLQGKVPNHIEVKLFEHRL